MDPLFLGIDLGTSGLRVVALNTEGSLVGQVSQSLTSVQPDEWIATLRGLWQELSEQVGGHYQAVAVSACSTSGSIVPIDREGKPVFEALLYHDSRGQSQARAHEIPTSWGLGRWLWWQETHPVLAQTSYLAHPSDVLLTALGGEPRVTDHTSALKSGFDPVGYCWGWSGIPTLDWQPFPRVVAPATPIGYLREEWRWGSAKTLIVAGITDGCAGQLASGAVAAGQVAVSLGTTLIFKGVSHHPLQTQDGSVYSHLHPDRQTWLPGAASCAGGGSLPHHFPDQEWRVWDEQAMRHLPTGEIIYPLWQPGERFPVTSPNFFGFSSLGDPRSSRGYAALLEGVGFVEKLGIERLQQLGLIPQSPILATGGGCRSPLWLRIRASILNRPLQVPQYPQPAVGAAILGAAAWWQCSVREASQRLVKQGQHIDPVAAWVDPYGEAYRTFCQRLRSLGLWD
ncbi:MAG: FGGY-family carbohydrate kinase [Cyanobacteriota bacterium]|nr:FGGY-family carbohydrate kinase [Cyanobacteriota bacterium]